MLNHGFNHGFFFHFSSLYTASYIEICIQPSPSMTSLVCRDPSKMVCSDPPRMVCSDPYKVGGSLQTVLEGSLQTKDVIDGAGCRSNISIIFKHSKVFQFDLFFNNEFGQ